MKCRVDFIKLKKQVNPPFPGAKMLRLEDPVSLAYGGELSEVTIAYETLGNLNAEKDNAILICPAFSAHSHVASHEHNQTPGWWEKMVGSGLAIDTDRYFVICPSLLGGCYGTTGPTSPNPNTHQPYRMTFPVLSIQDLAKMHNALIEHFEIEQLHAAIGGSMGAMQVLEFAIQFPKKLKKFIAISGTDQTRPYTAGVRHIGRRMIMSDPAYNNGNYDDNWPSTGLKLAREVGTLFYRSRTEFNKRFDWNPLKAPTIGGITFDVQSYLDYQGSKVVTHFDPNTYVLLSMCMDLHNVAHNRESLDAAYQKIEAKAFIIGVKEDSLIPCDEQRGIHDKLIEMGKDSSWEGISSLTGHDAFLVESKQLTPMFQDFLEG